MTARVYTVLLGTVAGQAGQRLDVFTARAGYVTVLRDIVGWVSDSAAVTLEIIAATGISERLLVRAGINYPNVFHLSLRQVLDAGDVLKVKCDGLYWGFTFTGYELLDDAEARVAPHVETWQGDVPSEQGLL